MNTQQFSTTLTDVIDTLSQDRYRAALAGIDSLINLTKPPER